MILAVNMVGSSIYTLLALIAIITQNCPLAHARPDLNGPSSHHRSHNSNTNINTNINTFRKSRRLYEAIARSEAEDKDDKKEDVKEVQTAVIATAAADAAKTVTRALTKRLGDSTADAVANAVIRVLTEDADKRTNEEKEKDRDDEVLKEKEMEKEKEKEKIKAAKRASRFLNEALSRLMYRSDSSPSPAVPDTPSKDMLPPDANPGPEIVEKMLLAGFPPGQTQANDKSNWADGDGAQSDADQEDGEAEANKAHRRFLEYSEPWKTHYRRAAALRSNMYRLKY